MTTIIPIASQHAALESLIRDMCEDAEEWSRRASRARRGGDLSEVEAQLYKVFRAATSGMSYARQLAALRTEAPNEPTNAARD